MFTAMTKHSSLCWHPKRTYPPPNKQLHRVFLMKNFVTCFFVMRTYQLATTAVIMGISPHSVLTKVRPGMHPTHNFTRFDPTPTPPSQTTKQHISKITLTPSTHHIAIDTTAKELATNHLANTLTPAANVTALATPLFDAPLKPAHHSVLSPATPLSKTVTTPINVTNFAKALSTHPNHELTSYLIDGLINGFDVGYKSSHTATLPNNLLSATKHV